MTWYSGHNLWTRRNWRSVISDCILYMTSLTTVLWSVFCPLVHIVCAVIIICGTLQLAWVCITLQTTLCPRERVWHWPYFCWVHAGCYAKHQRDVLWGCVFWCKRSLYTIPVTTATAEWTFSVLQRLKTSILQSSIMSQPWLNHARILHIRT